MTFRDLVYFLFLVVFIIAGCGGNDSTSPNGSGAPTVPTIPIPADNATGISTTAELRWYCSDPDGDTLFYDIYLGTSSPPPQADSNLTIRSYSPNPLQASTVYYWQIVARDNHDHQTAGPVWSFATVSGQVLLVGSYGINGAGGGYYGGFFVASDYAYIGANGMDIVDISNPESPSSIGSYGTGTNMGVQGIAVSGNYAYLACYSSDTLTNGFLILDVSSPGSPQLLSRYSGVGNASDVAVSGQYAYVLFQDDTLRTFNVTDPVHPALLGGCFHGNVGSPLGVAGHYAYIGGNTTGIVDISNPANPREVGSMPTSSLGIYISGMYAYLAGGQGLAIYGVSNPTSPALIDMYYPGNPKGVAVAGNYAYVASDESGVFVLNVADPANAFTVGTYDTPKKAWAVFFANGLVYLIDMGHSQMEASDMLILRYVP